MCGSGKERIFNYCDNSAQLLRFSGWKCVVGGQVSEKEDRKVLNKPDEIIFFHLLCALWRRLRKTSIYGVKEYVVLLTGLCVTVP